MDKIERPEVLSGKTIRIMTGCGHVYLTINEIDGVVREVFCRLAKAGSCASSQTEVIGRLVSTALRYDVPIDELVSQLSGISCHVPYGIGDKKVRSCADAVARALKIVLSSKEFSETKEHRCVYDDNTEEHNSLNQHCCPYCGSPVLMSEGCEKCSQDCGWSRCG